MLQELKLKDIHEDENYRTTYDETAMKELTASVKDVGVIEPLIVVKNGNGWKLKAGYRRYRAAKAAGLETVPCNILDPKEVDVTKLQMIENMQREDVNPMDEGEEFMRILKADKKETVETIAKAIRKSKGYVLSRCRITTLSEKAKKAVREGILPLSHALTITRIPDKKNQDEFLQEILDRREVRMTAKEARDNVRQSYGTDIKEATFDTAECKTCQHLTTNQNVLFEMESKDPALCLNFPCFRKKTLSQLDALEKAVMHKDVVIIKEWDKYIQFFGAAGSKAVPFFAAKYSVSRNPKPKQFAKECGKCDKLAFVRVLDERYQRMEVLTGDACLNRSCYVKLINPPKEGEKMGKAEAAAAATASSTNKTVKAVEVRDRFIDATLPAKFEQKATIPLRLALYHILVSCIKTSYAATERFPTTLLANFYKAKKKNSYEDSNDHEAIMRAINQIPPDELYTYLSKALLRSLNDTPHDVKLHLMSEAGIDVEKEFKIDTAFVNTMTKSELPGFVKELKLDLSLGDDLKKTEMVEKIMAFDLTGKTTKEIRAVCKTE